MYIERLFLLFNTIRFLKFRQIYFRIFYLVSRIWRKIINSEYVLSLPSSSQSISLSPSIIAFPSYRKNEFTFLNLSHSFNNKMNWNYSEYGKLWTYNLTYFDYLQQENMTQEVGLILIHDFINQSDSIKDGFKPFPISLRGINWIKFLSKYHIKDQKINDSLYAQYFILMDNLEYHLLGNHLLENGFSLLFGAYYFQDEKFYIKAKKILIDELEEQVLKDGAHFELSPMYHQIMLFRVLDSINLVQHNHWKKQELLEFLISKAEVMLGWLNTITYANGDIPLLNDSTNNIAPTTKELNAYAATLKVKTKKIELSESGYRKVKNERYEIIMDVGNIGPDYIPGHAHSDTFNFELYIDGKPIIVDTGLSTYETNTRRTVERSTASHNTVEVDGIDQSEVWGGFRVGRRAKIIHLLEDENYIEATHNGYQSIGVLLTRKFTLHEKSIVIEDILDSSEEHKYAAYLHFYPGILPEINNNNIILLGKSIVVYNMDSLEIEEYRYASEFNKITKAFKVKILFSSYLKMEIEI